MHVSPGTAFFRQAGSAARVLATCRLRSALQKRAAPGTTNGDGARPLAVRPAMLPVIAGKRCCSSCARALFYRCNVNSRVWAGCQVWGAQNRAVADSEHWLQHGAGRYRDARQFCRSFCPKSCLRGTGVARLCPSRHCRGGSRLCLCKSPSHMPAQNHWLQAHQGSGIMLPKQRRLHRTAVASVSQFERQHAAIRTCPPTCRAHHSAGHAQHQPGGVASQRSTA